MLENAAVLLLVAFNLIGLAAAPVYSQQKSRSRNTTKPSQSTSGPTISRSQQILTNSPVWSVAFSPNGEVVATGNYDGVIQFWRVSDGSLIRTFTGNPSSGGAFDKSIVSVAFSPDGQILASSGSNNTIRLWKVDDGRLLQVLEGQTKKVSDGVYDYNVKIRSIAFSPDGTMLASGSDYETSLWRVSDGSLLQLLEKGQGKGASTVAFSADNKTLYGDTKIWNIQEGTLLRKLPDQCVGSTAFSPGAGLAAAIFGDTLRVCRLSDGRPLQSLKVLPAKDYDLTSQDEAVFAPHGEMVISAASAAWRDKGWETTLRVWALPQGRLLQSETVALLDTSSIAVSPDGNAFAIAGHLYPSDHSGGVLQLWRLSNQNSGPKDQSPGSTSSESTLTGTLAPRKQNNNSRRNIDLVGTTWKLFLTNDPANEFGTYTFLSAGRIQEDEEARWKLVGNRLTITEQDGDIELIVKGNLMTGGGQLGMNPRPFRMRGTRVQENAVSSVSLGQSSLGNWPDLDNWTELDRGQKKGALQFSQGGTLLFGGRPIAGVRFKSTVDKIAVSPPAVEGKYAICVTFDQAASVGFLIYLDRRSGKRLTLEGPPSVWTAWSASGKHAVISSYYEGDPMLYSISLPAGTVRRFSLNVAKGAEEENYDLDKLTWVDNNVFHLQVSVNCNPYTDESCSDQDRAKVLREYEVRANVVTLAVSSKRLR